MASKQQREKYERICEVVTWLARGESSHQVRKKLADEGLSPATQYRYLAEARQRFNEYASEYYFPPTVEGHLVARHELYQACMAAGKYETALRVLDSLAEISGVKKQVVNSFATSDGQQITFYFPAQGRNPELEQANGHGLPTGIGEEN